MGLYLILIASFFLPAAVNAAELAINPPSVAADYTGLITLNVSGLANGQTVRFEAFLDLDGDGQIDAGEMLIQSFEVTDGEVLTIGGVRNINVPGDEDSAANGEIRAAFAFRTAELNQPVAKQVYRVSPVTGNFSPVTAAFAITQPSYSQQVIGQVRSGGSGVGFAFAVLLRANGGPQAIALADASGNFTVNCPPGTFFLIAVKPGFLANLEEAPQVTVNPGATVTQDLSLIAADRTISGRLIDSDGMGVPGIPITAQAVPALLAIAFSESDGNFTIPVSSTATTWELDPSSTSTALLGLLVPEDPYVVNTGGDDASGVSIQCPTATALIHGTARDDQGIAVTGQQLSAEGEGYAGVGFSDSDGNYAIGVLAGNWNVSLDLDDDAPGFLLGRANVNVINGQALRQDFILRRVTAEIHGSVKESTANAPLEGVSVRASLMIGSTQYFAEAETDSNGDYSLGVFDDTWEIGPDCEDDLQPRGYACPDRQAVAVSGTDRTADFIVVPAGAATLTPTATPPRTATPTPSGTPTPSHTPAPCVGDCSNDGTVTVDELVTGVSIALGLAGVEQCPELDCNGTGSVTVDCLLKAVNAALTGCADE